MNFQRRKVPTFLFTVSILLAMSSVTFAAYDVNTSQGFTITGAELALRGYDPVAYFTSESPVLGKADLSASHNGATYRFVSQKHLELFKKNPNHYIPQYGGFCAFGVAVGAKFDGDPHLWKIVDGKLYLNLNPEIQQKWLSDIPVHITNADSNWKKIKDTAPAELK